MKLATCAAINRQSRIRSNQGPVSLMLLSGARCRALVALMLLGTLAACGGDADSGSVSTLAASRASTSGPGSEPALHCANACK